MMPDLNLRHLRTLGLIAARGSLSAAAEAAGLSQPALTQGLAKLEQQFGVQLFDRLPRGLRPTAIGARVLVRIDRALALFVDEIQALAGAGRRGRRPELHLTAAQVRALLFLAGDRVGRAPDGVARSSVRCAVRELERLAGTALTDRRVGGLFLTEAGRAVVRGFALGAAELDIALQEAARQPARVAIGAMALSRSMLIPIALAEMSVLHPHVQIDVADGSYGELVEALRNGTIDMVIGTLKDAPDADVQQEVLLQDRITVIGRGGHPLVGHQPSLEELARFPWIVGRRTSALLERWQRIFDEAGVARPEAPIHCGSVTTIRGLLVRSDFLTLLSRDQVQVELETKLLAVIESEIPDTIRVIGAITRRGWFPSALQQRFLLLLREVAARAR